MIIFLTIAMYSLIACSNAATQDSTIHNEYPDNLDYWASSENLQITLNSKENPALYLTRNHKDYKPSWSKDASKITFFRLHSFKGLFGFLRFKDWRSGICVINSDGTGFRELTSGEYPDFNPTWTRDGSNMILFNRYSTEGGWLNRIYRISPDGSPGDEELFSDPAYPYCEWMTGALKDGRIFVDRIDDKSIRSYLLSPNPGNAGKYEEIKRPTNQLWHKLSISPGETKVAYMLDFDRNTATFDDAVICYADFNVKTLTISNQVMITKKDAGYINEYPNWNKDETLILYDSNRSGKYQVYTFRLLDGKTFRISSSSSSLKNNCQFSGLKGVPR